MKIVLPLCLIMFCSCQDRMIDHKLLLQGYEYKLWYIVHNEKDSLEWIDLDLQKLESFWIEEGWSEWLDSTNYNYDYVEYVNTGNNIRNMESRYFKKRKQYPEFLYIDRDGYACVLTLDRKAGGFVEKQYSEITGYWKPKNDSVIMLNNSLYLLKQTSNTIQLSNLQTGNSLEISDANFPPVVLNIDYNPVSWTKEAEMEHCRKWGFGIKQSPVLQEHDCKLWQTNKKIRGYYNTYNPFLTFHEPGEEYVIRYYYYCRFKYFDKYGRNTDLYLTVDEDYGRRWRMREYENLFCKGECDEVIERGWKPAGNDSICDYWGYPVKISCINKDTLYIYDPETDEEDTQYTDDQETDEGYTRYTAVNLPPKSKWEKFKKR